jgi:D-alanyl-D-alanine carboxypeptidase
MTMQPLDAAEPVLSHQANAAPHRQGPRFTWVTKFLTDGPIRDGVLEGDLIVKGGVFLLFQDTNRCELGSTEAVSITKKATRRLLS